MANDRKQIRKGTLKRYSHATRGGEYYSTGVPTNGIVHVYRRVYKLWQWVPEDYFRAEFFQPTTIYRWNFR